LRRVIVLKKNNMHMIMSKAHSTMFPQFTVQD
jgi:hypothetical protein